MKADLHVHSIYSNHPSDWFLQRLGAGESYSKPKYIYKTAMARGMDMVTITDHNNIDGIMELRKKYPETTFTGVESTAYFPEDGCKVHILIYGFEEKHFEKIENKRKNIYELRDYLAKKKFPHAVAHPVYAVNGRLSVAHFEKLILLFNVFEGINGEKNLRTNKAVMEILSGLTKEKIHELKDKHGIEPVGKHPWQKKFIAGSDDSAGLFIGKTYTEAYSLSADQFLSRLRKGECDVAGRSNDFASLAFSVYKVAWDYTEKKNKKFGSKFIGNVNDLIFDTGSLSLMNKIKLKGYNVTVRDDDVISRKIIELVKKLEEVKDADPEIRIKIAFDSFSNLTDELVKNIGIYLRDNLKDMDVVNSFMKAVTVLPALFLTTPFITAMNYLFRDRELIRKLKNKLLPESKKVRTKVLWFTDTIDDLNGVSATLKEYSNFAYEEGLNVKIAACITENENRDNLPPNIFELNSVFDFHMPYYESYTLKVPSLLESLRAIYDYDPDEIYISTPGFVGLVGLLAAKLLKIPSINIFHTDFEKQLAKIADDDLLNIMMKSYIRWFYDKSDIIASPALEYKYILEEYGFDNRKIKRFRRWVNESVFYPGGDEEKTKVREYFNLNGKPLLLFTGRISKDKNLNVVFDSVHELNKSGKKLNLMIAGDGPYLKELKLKYSGSDEFVFTGKIDRGKLGDVYRAADLFVFPSETDTFGMSVLEAQACGIPCLVSGVGGPREIIINNNTGLVVESNSKEEWKEKISSLLFNESDDEYSNMKIKSVENVRHRYSLEKALKKLIVDFDEVS